jgi:hypothetical protein
MRTIESNLSSTMTLLDTITPLAASPDREHIIAGSGESANSPTSVVDGSHHFQQSRTTTSSDASLPSLEEIQLELSKIVKRSANSKASYHAKLAKLTNDLRQSSTLVQVLQDELDAAKAKRDKDQQEVEAAKQRREQEAERIAIRKLNLDILRFCVETDRVLDMLGSYVARGGLFDTMTDSFHGGNLVEARSCLEEIHHLFTTANKFLAIKDSHEQKRGQDLQDAAIQLYMAYKSRNLTKA